MILQIEVEPRNHHAPVFPSLVYEMGLPETAPAEYLIFTFTAKDPDRSIFGQVKYYIAECDEPDLLELDEDTGELRLSSNSGVTLDRERKGSHTLDIMAQDGGGWLGYTKVVLKVSGKSKPRFPVSEYRVTISSDRMKVGSPILQVRCLIL